MDPVIEVFGPQVLYLNLTLQQVQMCSLLGIVNNGPLMFLESINKIKDTGDGGASGVLGGAGRVLQPGF